MSRSRYTGGSNYCCPFPWSFYPCPFQTVLLPFNIWIHQPFLINVWAFWIILFMLRGAIMVPFLDPLLLTLLLYGSWAINYCTGGRYLITNLTHFFCIGRGPRYHKKFLKKQDLRPKSTIFAYFYLELWLKLFYIRNL